MTFNTRYDVERAAALLESAAGDMRRALAHAPGQDFWVGYQRQAQAACLEVCASMDLGAFDLPHPWDLRPRGAASDEERAYRHETVGIAERGGELCALPGEEPCRVCGRLEACGHDDRWGRG